MNELFMAYDRWGGLIPILLGVYFSLIAYGFLPRKSKEPEKMLEWHKKFGGMTKVLGPLVALSGVVSLMIGLSSAPVSPASKRVFAEFYRANEARAARGANLASAEQFLADLRKIDLSKAPQDVRSAMQDYIGALADGLNSLKVGQPNFVADAKMGEAQQRLLKLQPQR